MSGQRVCFTVYGEPKAQRRAGEHVIPLAKPVGGRTHIVQHFDRSKDDKRNLALLMQQHRPEGGPFTGPVLLVVRAFRMIPKATSKKMRAEMYVGRELPAKVPDLDNVLKLLKDAAKSILWLDDKQVVGEVIIKRYADIPRTEYLVVELTNGRLMDFITGWLQSFAGRKGPGTIELSWGHTSIKMAGDDTNAEKHEGQNQDMRYIREERESNGDTKF